MTIQRICICRLSYLLLFFYSPDNVNAQRSKDQALEDSVMNWSKYAYRSNIRSTSNAVRSFSAYQIGIQDTFIRWIRQSYIPIGTLDKTMGTAWPDKASDVLPYSTGALAEIWKAEWNRSSNAIVRAPHSGNPLYILTNHIIDAEPIRMLTTPGLAVFTRRNNDPNKTFSGWPYGEKIVKELNLHNHSRFANYQVQYYGCTGYSCQPRVAVYLAPGNRLPIRQLTRAEVLDLCEKSIPAEIIVAKNKLKSTYGHRPKSLQEEYKRFEETVLPKWKMNIQKLRDKYKTQLNEPAEIKDINGIEMIIFFNGDDIFSDKASSQSRSGYGVYTYEDGVLEKSREDKSLWICISWWPATIDQSFYARELHRSMMEHFNFDYVYNFFFAPEKIKGQSYTILNPQQQQENITRIKRKQNQQPLNLNLPAGIHFLDDFSTNTPGSKPAGWYFANLGEPTTVINLPDETGSWVDLKTQRFIPTYLKRPLPENFRLEFDVACSNFTTSTGGGLELNINNRELTANGDEKDASKPVSIILDLRAGNEKYTNATGWVRLKTTYKGMPDNIRYADVLQYSNELSNQKKRIHIAIEKRGTKIKGYINNREITAIDKNKQAIPGFNELPEGAQLNSFYFNNTTAGKENRIYISNIKITRL